MALKGSLRDFPITQILNLINLARKTGTVIIDGAGDAARLTFRDGKLSYGEIGREDNSLASVLFRNKRISAGQFRILKERASSMSDKELGLLLVNAGYITQQDVLGSVQQYLISLVRRLYSWVEGTFSFDPTVIAPDDRILVRLDLENLIIEGSRQQQEWEQLQAEIPSLDMALKFAERPGANIRNVSLSVEEWRVVSFINPKNTIRQIGRATKMNDMEIRRIVFSLLQAGLIEIIRPEGTAVLPARAMPSASKDEQKGLVNKLISRIRSL